ncbi:hypothetical protein LCGC14_2691400 [marine sediment metagenome]|uniref:Uncharacterized protein n=1 Tax=marine sediment metagenome TaxID=412755 RepID=A0A0F9BT44_9ZZZZ
MIEVHFYNENSKNVVLFKKMMESPPGLGEEIEVLVDPSNTERRVYYEVIHIKTTMAVFETGPQEIKSIVLKEVKANQGQVDISQVQAPSQ